MKEFTQKAQRLMRLYMKVQTMVFMEHTLIEPVIEVEDKSMMEQK